MITLKIFTELSDHYCPVWCSHIIIQKVIYEDISTLKSLKTPTMLVIEKIFKYIVNSSPGELNVNKLAKLLSKDFDSIALYLSLLQASGLIRVAAPKKFGKSVFRNASKLYPDNTCFINAISLPGFVDETIGKTRETFFLNQLQNAGEAVYASTVGDFEINDVVLEVGGKNKTRKQLKDTPDGIVVSDGILVGTNGRIPLYLFGFLQ